MDTQNFYQSLRPFTEFSESFNHENYQSMPDDWWVIVADIVNSTQAIETGQYKSVNFVGSLAIIAVINLLSPLKFPYVFGGDGASLLVPDDRKDQVLEVLIATAQTAMSNYGLEFRIGAIKVQTIRQLKSDIQIAKFNLSKNYQQAFFMGGGLSLADSLVKKDFTFQVDVTQKTSIKADFSGLECRWQDIHSQRGQVISLLIEVTDKNDSDKLLSYKAILQQLDCIVGNKQDRLAVTSQNLNLSLSPKQLSYEAKLSAASKKRWLKITEIIIENLLGKFLLKFAINQWRFYKENLTQTTDAEKFDDTLRMVFALTEIQLKQLTHYLEQEYQQKKLIYGLHVSNRSLMTCLIFERHGQQVHFIDAADGGYALAAKGFKQRKKAIFEKSNLER